MGLWLSEEEKEQEWRFAKRLLFPGGNLTRNGTKLRQKDLPNDLTHSFIGINGKMLAMAGHAPGLRPEYTKTYYAAFILDRTYAKLISTEGLLSS